MVTPLVVYRGSPKPNSWARWMVGRTMKSNQNNLISIVGKTGSGKTLSAISICETMSRIDGVPFTVEHIVFSLRELMDLINSNKLVRGSKIIFDEPQVSISAREFQSQANKVFNYLLSTFRHRNLTLFFCCPFESLLDKNTRKLFHGRFETMSIDRNNQTCRLKPRFIEYSDWKSEPYRKQLIIVYKEKSGMNKTKKLFYWDIPRPSKELEDEYEQKKFDFTNKINLNISERLKKYDESGKSITAEIPKEVIVRKPLTEKQEQCFRTLANIKESNKLEIASKILGISISAVSYQIKRGKTKGWTLKEFKNDEETIKKVHKNEEIPKDLITFNFKPPVSEPLILTHKV